MDPIAKFMYFQVEKAWIAIRNLPGSYTGEADTD